MKVPGFALLAALVFAVGPGDSDPPDSVFVEFEKAEAGLTCLSMIFST